MEIANCDGTGFSNSLVQLRRCYKVNSLTETILESSQVACLKDRYVLEEQLGWGQFGVIRACSDKLTGEVLACKSIAKDRLVTPDDLRSVKLEIEIMSRLSGHPNVVNLKAVYEEEDYVHLLMELCVGGELFHQLEKHGSFSEMEARVLFKQLMQVIKYCHDNGIVHRDLKPENILLASTSSSSPIKLADFGLATYIRPAGQRLHGTVGSPFYIAPEVLVGGYSQAADVWSAGVILYILLSGVPPFWGKTKSKIFEAVRAANLRFPASHWEGKSSLAKDLIAGMLQLDPTKRLTAAEVIDHPWMELCEQGVQETSTQVNLGQEMVEVGGSSFYTPVIARVQDYSFSYESHAVGANSMEQSPAFTCKSSFFSCLVGDGCSISSIEGFSFSSASKSSPSGPRFPSSVLSMPSFTFFGLGPDTEQQNYLLEYQTNMSNATVTNGESGLAKPLVLPDSFGFGKYDGEAEKRSETRRTGTGGSRLLGKHSKRNHMIGFGELDQIDFVVAESVIRWASCTHIPTAPSLRLSLVC
ncbi:calcium-dependent protein kinase 26 isoform X1 [Rhodamnia argentea]|uniref:Calcium-dependent protein kinase 26 isoform X1 n=1 Tax=Rhodamnia argentea TaxID=178133 RepID=A0A8B8NRP4_9MYRT|nr:calcium-dependent protein kinase 26 isoform X1 [Rhodamnia argentea]